VYLPPQSSLQLRQPLIGANLWDLDIRALADDLKKQQPWLKEIRVVRQLPNAIRIEPIPRVPIAQVRIDLSAQAGRWYPVDRDGFILPESNADPADRLIRLVGFERTGGALRAGRENTDERLKLALRVLEALRRAPSLIPRRLTEINVGNPQQIRFLIDGETEVRCGSEAELGAQLERLQAALKAVAKQPLDVRYIDVRFQEPVIGPRT
jgi:cell division septal protein FtsQ